MKLLQRDTPVSRIVPIGCPIATHTYRYYPYFGDYSSAVWVASGEDVNNNITVTGDYSFDMVGNGDTVLINTIEIAAGEGRQFKINLTVTGTGQWKAGASALFFITGQGAVTDQDYVFETTGSGDIFFQRNAVGQPTNLSFTINSLEEWR